MTDQLNFEMRLDAAVKVLAARADGPVDAARIAASAVTASRRAGWWTRLTSIAQPRTADLLGQASRLLLVAMVVVVAIGSIGGLAIYWQRATDVPPPASTATPAPSPSGLAPTPSDSAVDATPLAWPGAVRPDADAMPALAMDGPSLCVAENPITWADGLDAQAGPVDIVQTTRRRFDTRQGRGLALASKPPLASEVDPSEVLIQYGLVFDTNGDATPDYEVGINNSPGGGEYRVWLTDLGLGETVEKVGGPYGYPFEFRHPDEQEIGESDNPSMSFWFLGGPVVQEFRGDDRYYAWSSYSEKGSVVAWDYAPDFGWLELPDCESLPVKGWPDAGENSPGLYSWDGSLCAGQSCKIGFMHNGNGSGDVEIRVDVVPGGTVPDSRTHTTVAGYDGVYRRIDAQREEWFVEIDGTLIEIALTARPGASQLDLADAHAIIESMRYERQDTDLVFDLGFRLVFALSTDDWDSG